MNRKFFEALVRSIDSKNAQYIIKRSEFESALSAIEKYEVFGYNSLINYTIEELKKFTSEFDKSYFTPANVRVGDGATINYFMERRAGTIINVTKRTITVQMDKAVLDENFNPNFLPTYTYEYDPNGVIEIFRWSNKYCRYAAPNLTVSKGRHEFYGCFPF